MNKILYKLNYIAKNNEILKLQNDKKEYDERINEARKYCSDLTSKYQNKINDLEVENKMLNEKVTRYEKDFQKIPNLILKIFGINKIELLGETKNEK